MTDWPRFITTHGFWSPAALEATWILASIASAFFGGLPFFKFGDDSETSLTSGAPGSKADGAGFTTPRLAPALVSTPFERCPPLCEN